VAQRFWNERLNENHLTGITAFTDRNSASPEELLLGQLDTICRDRAANRIRVRLRASLTRVADCETDLFPREGELV
jgi:hypothetical protein